MDNDINNFFTISCDRDQKVKVLCKQENVENMFKFLYEMGFRRSKFMYEIIYMHITGAATKHVDFFALKDAFMDFLQNEEYTNCPEYVSKHEILNCFFSNNPIKRGSTYEQLLNHDLTDYEMHILRLEIDPVYRNRSSVENMLMMFMENGFKNTLDSTSSYSNNPKLYFKFISAKKYLIFNHVKPKTGKYELFDCWIAEYGDEKLIGKAKPDKIEQVKLDFQLSKDLHLIEKYLT